MEKTLLEKAKEVVTKKRIKKNYDYSIDEKIDLIFAWANEEINSTQMSDVLKLTNKSCHPIYLIGRFFKEGVKAGKIKRVK